MHFSCPNPVFLYNGFVNQNIAGVKVKLQKLKQNIAFTLSEVLITLGIIGVIAAITIPALINSTQQREIITAWKKEYSMLSQATNQIIYDNGGTIKGVFTGVNPVLASQTVRDVYGGYLSYTKTCDYGATAGNCVAYWYALNGVQLIGTNWGNYSGAILKDGSSLYFREGYSDCSGSGGMCTVINVDVNGFKGPNILGKDVFELYIYENSVKIPGDGTTCSSYGEDCSSYYLVK